MNKLKKAMACIEEVSLLLDMPMPKVSYAPEVLVENKDETASYYTKEKAILFNRSWVELADQDEVCLTAYIQARYAYQHYAIELDDNEESDLLNIWLKEKTQNNQPEIVFDGEMDVAYMKQSYVIDAIAFGHLMLLERHDKLSYIPEEIKTLVIERIEELKIKAKVFVS